MGYFGCDLKVWIKNGHSPVSEVDLAVDSFLKEKLLEARPNYDWISEEMDNERKQQSCGRYFLVDPIDGTRGFLSGHTDWCISVAIIENGRPVVSVVQCPAKGDVYAAIAGGGAKLNGVRLPLLESRIDQQYRVSIDQSIIHRLPFDFCSKVRFLDNISSLAYRIILAAKGEVDAVLVRPNCHDWDIAAADLIIEECGGHLVSFDAPFISYGGEVYQYGFLAAGENNCRQNMIDVVRQAKLV
ncbi:Inositol monophosphatase family protein [Bartonella ancashensis]|uniref:Inositol monophosphatase family protein n=2 Tax=Bartonella ancashensis TaxID=1318743 RepID=A0A0M5KSJ5_9HYPH|nr:Inositol monophosphatase family protein [Bartonella ancashensis]